MATNQKLRNLLIRLLPYAEVEINGQISDTQDDDFAKDLEKLLNEAKAVVRPDVKVSAVRMMVATTHPYITVKQDENGFYAAKMTWVSSSQAFFQTDSDKIRFKHYCNAEAHARGWADIEHMAYIRT